jgi:site-specific recombinase XerC
MKTSAKHKIRAPRDPNRYPKGLNRKKVQALIDYYENQTDDQAIAEAEAAYRRPNTTMMQIPNKLVPEVRKLLAKRAG